MTDTNDDMIKQANEELDKIVEKYNTDRTFSPTKREGLQLVDVYSMFENAKILDRAINIAKAIYGVSAFDLDRYVKKMELIKCLGGYPKNADDFVNMFAESHNVEVTPSYVKAPFAMHNDRMCFADYFNAMYACQYDYGLKYDKERLQIAARQWQDFGVHHFNMKIYSGISDFAQDHFVNSLRIQADAEWDKFINIIEKNEDRRYYTKLVMQHWVWQVKRVMLHNGMDTPIMPVLVGKTSNGKSTAVKHFLSPLGQEGDCWITSKFTTLLDPNFIHINASVPVAFMDEMSYLGRADANDLKAFLTGDKVAARQLYSQNVIVKDRIIQPIGTSNDALAYILTDTTSSRRLYEIETPDNMKSAHPNWFNEIDWFLLWKSVDAKFAKSPIKLVFEKTGRDVMGEIFNIQHNEQRAKSFIETWFEGYEASLEGTHRANDLFAKWSSWAETYDNTNWRRFNNLTAFGREMAKHEFVCKKRSGNGHVYVIGEGISAYRVYS